MPGLCKAIPTYLYDVTGRNCTEFNLQAKKYYTIIPGLQTYSTNRSASSPKMQDVSPSTFSVGEILHDFFPWHNSFTLSFTPFVPQFCDIQLLSQVALYPCPWPKKAFVIAIFVPGAQDKETSDFWSSQPCTLIVFGTGSLICFTAW